MIEEEIWKAIPGYEGFYEASDLGRIRSVQRGIVLKQRIKRGGYLGLDLYKATKMKTVMVHQLVAMAFLNHRPNGNTMVVDHKDFNRLNNKLSNLQVITHRQNTNQKHLKSNTTSKYTGVYLSKLDGKFKASISVDNKKILLGSFEREIEASMAYEKAYKKLNSYG